MKSLRPHNQRGDAIVMVLIFAGVGLLLMVSIFELATNSFRDYRSAALTYEAQENILAIRSLLGSQAVCSESFVTGPHGAANAPTAAAPVVDVSDDGIIWQGRPLFQRGTEVRGSALVVDRILLRPYKNDLASSIVSQTTSQTIMIADLVVTFNKKTDNNVGTQTQQVISLSLTTDTATNKIQKCMAGNGQSGGEIRNEIADIGTCPNPDEYVMGITDGHVDCSAPYFATQDPEDGYTYVLAPGSTPRFTAGGGTGAGGGGAGAGGDGGGGAGSDGGVSTPPAASDGGGTYASDGGGSAGGDDGGGGGGDGGGGDGGGGDGGDDGGDGGGDDGGN